MTRSEFFRLTHSREYTTVTVHPRSAKHVADSIVRIYSGMAEPRYWYTINLLCGCVSMSKFRPEGLREFEFAFQLPVDAEDAVDEMLWCAVEYADPDADRPQFAEQVALCLVDMLVDRLDGREEL